MHPRSVTLLLTTLSLLAATTLAQPTIGGGTCASSSLNGTYELQLNGRQVGPPGTAAKIFQGVGTAVFDGLSQVTLNLTANTVTSTLNFGVPVVYSGTYSMQANCVGVINITTGDTGTFALEAFNQGNGFAVVGSDAVYAYTGSGTIQPAKCPTTMSGAHEFSGVGNVLAGGAQAATLEVAGILQFDGEGNVTANWTQVANTTTTPVTATGTYTVAAGCLASATLTDGATNRYVFSMSFNSASPSFALAVSSPAAVFAGAGAGAQPAAVTACTTAMLRGGYELSISGRLTPTGAAPSLMQGNGAAAFDGQGNFEFSFTSNAVNGSPTFGKPQLYLGTYSLQPNCQGSINITTGDTAAFAIVAYNFDSTAGYARSFQIVGADANYGYNGSGTVQPTDCALSTLSGEWLFTSTGNSLSGSAITGLSDLVGVMEFDGQGKVTADWTLVTSTGTTTLSATGGYGPVSGINPCPAILILTDTSNNTYTGQVAIVGPTPNSFSLVLTSPQLLSIGTGRAAFGNPGLAVTNNSDFVSGDIMPGGVFSVFGSDLATRVSQPTNIPLPTQVLTTSMTVNGTPTPLFYVSPTQLVAQMPWEIQPSVATVIVKNGSSTSNAVAILIPSYATPQINVFGNNRAVVTHSDYSIVSSQAPAKPGETLVLWFTGGGPVDASGKLTTGDRSPAGLSWVTGQYAITVGGVEATTINYVGLTPGAIGLYQANFVMPSVPAGDRAVQISILGQASNSPFMNVK